MRNILSLMTAVALAVPTVAMAQTAPSQAPVAPTTAAKKDKMICQTMESTGSRLGQKRVCRTAAEWAEINATDRRDIERMQANRYKGNQ